MKNLTLYYKPTCPYCHKVFQYMDQNGINVDLKNILENNYDKELLRIGGKVQVPCLLIDGKPLYESDDIIEWFAQNKVNERVNFANNYK